MFLKTENEKQNFNLTYPNSIFKLTLRNTSFRVHDVCQVYISGDGIEVSVSTYTKGLGQAVIFNSKGNKYGRKVGL